MKRLIPPASVASSRWRIVALCVCVMAVVAFGSFQLVRGRSTRSTDVGFFTTDDGSTFFKAAFASPPYEQDGKPATRAMVFSSDGGATCFVGYLIRPLPSTSAEREPLSEVRLPGPNQKWIPQPLPRTHPNDPRAIAYTTVTTVHTPHSTKLAAMVNPQL